MRDTLGYGRTAVFLHWLVAALVTIQFPLGWWMQAIAKEPAGPRVEAFNLHKSLGLLLLAIVAIRLAWRAMHRPPEWPRDMPHWRARLALVNHHLLYALLLALCLTGYVGSAVSGYPVKFFGMPLPMWAAHDEALKSALSVVHLGLGWALLAAFVVHVAGAATHRHGTSVAGRMALD
jgi:cytochrome b561